MLDALDQSLVDLCQRLLDAIAAGDWATYSELCDPSLTAFEPEARGHLVTGLDFHRYYFAGETSGARVQNTIVAPHVRRWDDAAVVSYVRLVQRQTAGGASETLAFDETRVWRRQADGWRHVHFHRSAGC